MNAMCAPMNAEPIEITLTQKNTSASIVTTLYDLIAAIQDVVDADDNTLVVATLRAILARGTRYGIHLDDDGLSRLAKPAFSSPGWTPKSATG